jgi:hypothetical protein
MKRRFRKILLLLVLWVGSQMGLPMRPEEIEELMRTMNEPKIVRKFAEEEERGDDPLGEPGEPCPPHPIAGSRTF